MRIKMQKHEPGIYGQWYVVESLDKNGCLCYCLIFPDQAKTYAQAVRFWREKWGKDHTAIELRNAKPFSKEMCLAC